MHPTAIFAAGFLILFVGGGARFAIGLTLKPMVTELGWARGELGIAVAAYLVISAFATYLAGRLADRTSPSLLLTTGVVVSGLGIGLMCLVGEPWHALLLYGVVFAVGNGLASLTPVGVMVTRAFPSRPGLHQRGRHLRHQRRPADHDRGAGGAAGRRSAGARCSSGWASPIWR